SSLFTQYQSIFPVMTPAGDSCYCMISSPEPEAAQGTSSILLALGVMFFPMGLMKGGLPSFRRMPGPPAPVSLPSGRVVTPVADLSGRFFAFGLVLILVGVDALLVPGYLVYGDRNFEVVGVLLAAAGALSILWGFRKPKTE
ncbi:MAG TPA: hypothetical protein VGR56_00465, partial [Nitrososphaerales archaeon]|nr:hypothetical protein [Nitrososphaerales archaeon]